MSMTATPPPNLNRHSFLLHLHGALVNSTIISDTAKSQLSSIRNDQHKQQQQSHNILLPLKHDLYLNDSSLFNVYHFIRNFIG